MINAERIPLQIVSQSEYEPTRTLPKNLISSLLSIEGLEAEPGGIHKKIIRN
jgi:hypothetical protein